MSTDPLEGASGTAGSAGSESSNTASGNAEPAMPDQTSTDPSPAPGAQWPYIVMGYLLAALGVGAALLFYPGHISAKLTTATTATPTGVTMFAGLYIAAQAVERLISPLSNVAGGIFRGIGAQHPANRTQKDAQAIRDAPSVSNRVVTKKQVARTLQVAMAGGHDAGTVAAAKADTAQFRSNSTVLMFGVATLFAGILTGVLGLTLLHQVGVNSAAVGWDLAVTALAVGAGTKPLHDLIGNISASKETKQDSQA
jgi:hypothetical protein